MILGNEFDFFLSRRGSVAAVASEVADVLTDNGYKVLVQDYDIPLTANFIEAMHEAIKSARDLVVLYTADYEASPYTRKEFTSFEAERAQSTEERRVVILRCEDVPLRGLFAPNVYQDLVGVSDAEERKRRIIAAAAGCSQASRPPPRPFVGAPPRIASFTGREAELDQLDAILLGGDKPAAITQASVGRAAVQGMGGVGKTSLAVEYAYRYRDLYSGVGWCSAERRSGLLTGLASLAKELGSVAADEADIEKAAKAGLRRLSERRATFLLVYDNVTSPDVIADLLPAAGARVLITSRFADWSEWAEEVGLDVLPAAEAVAFLGRRAGREDEEGADALAEALGYLPLALDHAAAYCKRTQMRFADYAVRAGSLIDTAPRGSVYPRSVAATFDLAITEAARQSPTAEPLMAYFGQCASERIPMFLVEGAIEDEAERTTALLALTEISLVSNDPFEDGTPAVMVHPLVQAVARARAEASGTAEAALERVTLHLATIFPADGYENPEGWQLCARLTPHLLRMGEGDTAIGPRTTERAALFDRAGNYFHARAAHPRAETLFRAALALREEVLGAEHPDTGVSLNNLGLLLHHRGDLVGARLLYERALETLEKALSPKHSLVATSLNNLATMLREKGDFAEARRHHERALAIREELLGPEHPQTATSLHNLANLLQGLGNLTEARSLYERALSIREKVLGPNHPDTAVSLINFALLLQDQGDLIGARQLYERALTISEAALGPEHPTTAGCVGNLASLLMSKGDLDEARPLCERAIAIYEKTLGPDHLTTATALNNLARLLRDMGHASEAEPLFQRAIAVGEKVLGPNHPLTQRFQSNYARLLILTGRPDAALALGTSALAIHEKVLGPGHLWIAYSAGVTADALNALARSEEAETIRARYGLGHKG
jgi:tetratricopeptide (TPR) repeat protein